MKFLKKYPYLFSLSLSFLLLFAAWQLGWVDRNMIPELLPSQEQAATLDHKASPDAPQENTEEPDETTETPTDTENNPPQIPELPDQETPDEEVPVFYTADRTYFDDALFIGDSRTVGLYEYGNLGNAVVLADSGMSIYKISTQTFKIQGGEKVSLDSLLDQKQFGKIYLMLGINELGYSYEQNVKLFKELVTSIQEKQPDARIFLEANLHVTEKKSSSSDIYNNANINRFNDAVCQIAEENSFIYLDVNERFDDASGSLASEYTADEIHVLGKYYVSWVEWLLEHAV